MWTPETLACRGLIVHGDGTVWARPFGKFFNAAEHEMLPTHETFEVYDKLDGSAEFFADKPNRAVLFRMYDAKPYDTIIWRMLRPDFAKPFKSVDPG